MEHVLQRIVEPSELRTQIRQVKQSGKRVAFVPTMGNLHQGHLTLVREAKKNADIVVVSIFVNPMQFERADDLEKYPRTLEQDLVLLQQEGTDLVFTPEAHTIYPNGLDAQTYVEVPTLSHVLEGASRPGHFRGVATIVTKLFNLVQPDIACFGEKDFQQLAVIRQMVIDLAMGIEIIGVPTVREADGLAMSSRNNRLTPTQRNKAPKLAEVMHQTAEKLKASPSDYRSHCELASQQLQQRGFQPDELFIVDADRLCDPDDQSKRLVVLMAAFLGDVRLIDNQIVEL